jgi:anti-anti-sigma factor
MPQASVVTSPTACRYLAASSFSCSWREGGSGTAWVRIAGEVDLATSPLLEQTLREAQCHARLVVLDLRELTFIDCVGVRVILDAANDARQTERGLIAVRGRPSVDRVLTLTGAHEHLEIVDLDPSEGPVRALLHRGQRLVPA